MPGVPFKKGRRLCIFCGQFGKITGEHIWADWMEPYIPREMAEHRVRHTRVSPERPEEITITRRTGDPHSRRVPCVCAGCNNGWMSELQVAAKPFLVPMLTAKEIRLHRRAQKILAAWIAMLVMVSEHLNREQVTVPEEDRRWLWQKREAPPHWRIWIGAHSAQQHPIYSHNSLEFAEEGKAFTRGPATKPNTQTSTVCVGHYLVFHTMSSRRAWRILRRWRLPPPIAPHLHQIWPMRESIIGWVPTPSLNDAGMALLANQFMNAAQRLLAAIDSRGTPAA